MPSPHLRAYPPETVIAEKFHAMVALGRANSRMKDYYGVWMLTRIFTLDPLRLRQAIAATFARRDTAIPALVPGGLSDAFATDPVAEATGRVCKQRCPRVPGASYRRGRHPTAA